MQISRYNINYLIKVKEYTENLMVKYNHLADKIEDEFYKLLIKIGENKYSDFSNREYYLKIQSIINN